MKSGQSLRCLFWAALYCLLYLVTASEEDLMDFDFSDLKEIDWNYESDTASDDMASVGVRTALGDKNVHRNVLDLSDDDGDGGMSAENQVRPFDWREKLLRGALSRALTNKALRQKFVEVMPILRVLSPQQRLALSALILAQINAKKGQELKFEQVRSMFGNDKKLLIPLVYDIANLVQNSARKYLQNDFDAITAAGLQQTPIQNRDFELTSEELAAEEDNKDVGTVPSQAATATATAMIDETDGSLEDFMLDMSEELLDPLSINEALQDGAPKVSTTASPKTIAPKRTNATAAASVAKTTTTINSASPKRKRRAATSSAFVHKLVRSVPTSVSEDDLAKGAAGRTIKLNTTAFLIPNDLAADPSHSPAVSSTASPAATDTTSSAQTPEVALPYHIIEDLAFASLNGSELDLGHDGNDGNETLPSTNLLAENSKEPLPNPEELIAGPRYRIGSGASGGKMRPGVRHKTSPAAIAAAAKRKRVQLRPRPKAPVAAQSAVHNTVASKKCERFTASMCIRTDDYPLEQIMGSIRRHKNAMSALLAEFYDRNSLESTDDVDEFAYANKRREDEGSGGGGMCQSLVRYARPQKARSASGEWKYIVNTGQHTQTLRLEKCSNPQESCSYLAHNYRSHCAQVYNYHRLLSWDKTRGLHVDIFKVPTCCSCQIDGYRQQFPPLNSLKAKEYTPAYNSDIYSTINDELDYNDEEDDVDTGYGQHHRHHPHHKSSLDFDANELLLGSKKVRTNAYPPNPTVGSYLSPPGSDEYDTNYSYKSQRPGGGAGTSSLSSSSKSLFNPLSRRRPYKSLSAGAAYNEARVDLEIAPSEQHADKEVNIYGTTIANDKTRFPQNRKRIYSVPHTATSSTAFPAVPAVPAAAATATAATAASAVSPAPVPVRTNDSSRIVNNISNGRAPTTVTYQTPATSPNTYYTSSVSNGHGYGGFIKSHPRLPSPGGGGGSGAPAYSSTIPSSSVPSPAAAATPATSSESPYRFRKQPSSPSIGYPMAPQQTGPLYHVNSIYSSKYNTTNGISAPGPGPKRINYNYHPIIDFFESNKRSAGGSSGGGGGVSVNSVNSAIPANPTYPSSTSSFSSVATSIPSPTVDRLYPHKIPKSTGSAGSDLGGQIYQSRERRIGYGAGGAFSAEDNSWHPMVVEA